MYELAEMMGSGSLEPRHNPSMAAPSWQAYKAEPLRVLLWDLTTR